MNIDTLEIKRQQLLATAREIATAPDGDLSQVKSIMAEAETVADRIATIKSLGTFAPAPVEAPKANAWDGGSITKSVFSGSRAEQNLKGYVMGQFALSIAGNKRSQKWMQENGHFKAQVEGTTTLGGFLTPDLLSADLIYLREQYGVARQNARIVPMASDVQLVPNATASTTVYYPGENTAITASDMTFAQISLTAKKLAVLTIVSKELNEDSVVDVGNALARDFAYGLAKEEDRVVFSSARTGSDASGMVGIGRALTDLVSGVAGNYGNIAGAVIGAVGTATAWTGFTLANLQTLIGRGPTYAGNMKWYMNKQFFYTGIADKLAALGGNNIESIANAYGPNPVLYGLPVVFVQNMIASPAASFPVAFLADLSAGLAFGDRRGITVEMSDQRYFVEDSYAYKATERYAINAFDIGNADATAANRVPGSLLVLIAAAT